MFGLVDCNNFFASCEKVFNPKFEKQPLVVLSNNDGCVIARSQEAKALSIPMGAPAFQYEPLFKKFGVVVLSANFPLYLDMSERVMQTLCELCPRIQVYSIDEAFLALDDLKEQDLESYACLVRNTIRKWTGLYVSVGIAPTKALTKVANRFAKLSQDKGVFVIRHHEIQKYLEKTAVEDLWGIGRRLRCVLKRHGIHTAWQLCCKDDLWIKKHLTVVGLRLVMELRGISCLDFEEVSEPKKTISTAKSFETLISSKTTIDAILSEYTANVALKLREQKSLASCVMVWIQTNPHKIMPQYSQSGSIALLEPTNFTPTLINAAKTVLSSIYKEGYAYKKVGVLLCDLISENTVQKSFFESTSIEQQEKQKRLMQVVDRLNAKEKNSICFASQMPSKRRQGKRSFAYTTSWLELPVVYA